MVQQILLDAQFGEKGFFLLQGPDYGLLEEVGLCGAELLAGDVPFELIA